MRCGLAVCDMAPLPFEHFISVGKDVLVAAAAVVGAIVAIRGLNTWNRQLKGSAEYDLARRILKVCYRFRDAIRSVRHPVMWGAEMPNPSVEEAKRMLPEETYYYGQSRAYQARWQRVSDVRTDLQAELLEAEVLWGGELNKLFEVLFKLEHELFVAVQNCLSLCNPKVSEAMKTAIEKRQLNARDIMYDSLEEGGDQFTKDVTHAIAPIEEYLKPHLRK
jgi:hypothetical protein